MHNTYRTGALLSPPDRRDYIAQSFNPIARGAQLEKMWSFEGHLPPVRNQLDEGTCVGHAMACVMGYGQNTVPPIQGQPPDREILSVRDIYEGARFIEPVGPSEGAYPRAALRYAQKIGVCREDLWPYKPHVKGMASLEAAASRASNRLATYSRTSVSIPQATKTDMYWHGPALIVINVSDNFYYPAAGGSIAHPAKQPDGGAHAIVICGWDDGRQAWRIRNSWGTEWGDGGSAWLPYSWPLLEAWVCTPAIGTVLEKPWWERILPWTW